MNGVYLRKYGEAATIDFELFEIDGVDFRVDAIHAAGDTVIMKDEEAETSTTNGFTDEGTGYSMILTATEMQAARIVVYLVDLNATKVWLDRTIIIETYGNASAQHEMDFDQALGSASDLAAAVFAFVLENSKTFAEVMRIMKAVLTNNSTGDGKTFRDDANTKNRLVETIDGSNNRTVTSQDGS